MYIRVKQFSVMVTASNGCKGIDDIFIDFVNVTDVEGDAKSFQVFPIPADRELHVQVAGGNNFAVHLYDVNGRSVLQQSYYDGDMVVNTAPLQSGAGRYPRQ